MHDIGGLGSHNLAIYDGLFSRPPLLTAVWRVSQRAGAEPRTVDRVIEELPFPPSAVFPEGVSHGATRFNYNVSGADDLPDLVAEIGVFLEWLNGGGLTLASIESELDIGFGVGEPEHFTRTIRLPPTVLKRLARNQITLAVSGYPVCEE